MYFMFFFADIPLIFLSIIFITLTNILTHQHFIHSKQSLISPLNSTIRKYFTGNNHLFNLSISTKFSRKRRQTNADFRKDSLKYFTCAIVNRRKNHDTPAFIPCILILTLVLILVGSVHFLSLQLPAYENYSLFRQQTASELSSSDG